MKTFVAAFALVAILAVTTAFVGVEHQVIVKCPDLFRSTVPAAAGRIGRDPGQRPPQVVLPAAAPSSAVYIMDGRIVERAVFEAMDRKAIESISVVCSDDSHRVHGVEPGRDLVLIITKPGLS